MWFLIRRRRDHRVAKPVICFNGGMDAEYAYERKDSADSDARDMNKSYRDYKYKVEEHASLEAAKAKGYALAPVGR